MSKMTDKMLIDLLNSNKRLGFKHIVEKFQERIYWQIRRVTKNHQDTEDVLQNVFLKVWNNLEKFEGRSALYSWIYRIAHNETINFINKSSLRKHQDIDDPVIKNQLVVNGTKYSSQEISDILYKAIEQLPKKQAQVFELKYFDDLKYTEISELTGTSVGGLKASYHIAVKKIEEFINGI